MFYELTWMKNEFCLDALVRVEKYAVRLLIFLHCILSTRRYKSTMKKV